MYQCPTPFLGSRSVDPQKAFSGQTCDMFNMRGIAVDGERHTSSLYDTRLAEYQKLFSGKFSVINVEFSFSRFPSKPTCQIMNGTPKTVMPKCIGKVGETGRIYQNNAVQSNSRCIQHELNRRASHVQECRSGIELFIMHERFQHTQLGATHFLEEGGKQVVFTIKMVVKSTFGNSRFLSDLGHRRSRVATSQKNFASSFQNLYTLCAQIHRCGRVVSVVRHMLRHCFPLVSCWIHRPWDRLTEPFGHCKGQTIFRSSTTFMTGAAL